jgi:hypothetical protein
MVYRICRDNNKKPSSVDPGVQFNQSYLMLSPAMTPANSDVNMTTPNRLITGTPEPNIYWDDYHYRGVRDALGKIPEPEPLFGIPREKCISGASNQDYLHAIPDPDRYRPTFNARKNPDTVMDDLAYRALRKDDNLSDPNHLGIVKDPNVITTNSSCWKHKMESKLNKPEERPQFPHVFYPGNRNSKLLQVLSDNIANVIRRQSGTARGGNETKVVTYDDLLKDPDVMASMKHALNIPEHEDVVMDNDGDENDKMVDGRPRWAGKTIYELFKAEMEKLEIETASEDKPKTEDSTTNPIPVDSSSSSEDGSSPSPPPLSLPQVFTVQHCVMDHDKPVFQQLPHDDQDKKKETFTSIISSQLDDQTTAVLRSQERSDSDEGQDDDPPIMDVSPRLAVGQPESNSCLSTSEGETGFLAWLDNPAFLAACYCLALLHQLGQLGGLDFLTTLGIVLAMVSMMSMVFL